MIIRSGDIISFNVYALQLVMPFICLLIFYMWRSSSKIKLPPGPFSIPIVGSMPFMEFKAEKTFAKWSKKYGPIITVQTGNVRNVVLNNYEAVEQAFVKQASQFNLRHKTYLTQFASEGGHGILFLSEDMGWKSQRRFGLKVLSGASLPTVKVEDIIVEEAENLCNIIRSKAETGPFIIEDLLLMSTANVISGFTFQMKIEDKGSEQLLAFLKHIIDGFRRDWMIYSLLTVLPWLRFLPPIKSNLPDMKNGITNGNILLNEIIEMHDSDLDSKSPRDFIDLFLIKHKQNKKYFSIKQLRCYLRDLFAASTETTTSTIRWTLLRLIEHQDIQEKIHQEIDRVLGVDGNVRADSNLPYTRAVIQETYRINPVTPLGVPRSTSSDVEFMGYTIPKNTQVIANLWWIHHNPETWPNPEIFDPTRHLDKNGNFIKFKNIIPFQIGMRSCLGESLARMEVFVFIVSILQKYKICINPKSPNVALNCNPGIVASPPHYPMIMKER